MGIIERNQDKRIRELEAALKLHEAERDQTLTSFREAAKVREEQMAKVTAERERLRSREDATQQTLQSTLQTLKSIQEERDEAVDVLEWARGKMLTDEDKHMGPGWLNDLWKRVSAVLARIGAKP